MSQGLSAYRYWAAVGWLMLIAIVVLSLVRLEQPLEVRHADKAEHLLAYGALMYWWGMVQPARRLHWATILPLLGLLLEWLQSMIPHRFMDWNDSAANAAGVVVGLVLLASPAGRLLAAVDRKLANRVDSSLP